jgi:hypothetical protein
MRYRRLLYAVLVGILAYFGVTWVDDEDTEPVAAPSPASASATATTLSPTPSAEPTTEQPPTTPPTTTSGPVVPSVVGHRLGAAITELVAEGYVNVVAVDAAGDKVPVNPENWIVRSQEPAAGTGSPVTTRVRLIVVKPSEPVGPGNGGVPEVVCTDLPTARGALAAAGYEVRTVDGTGRGRLLLVESNWLVVGQSPAAGSRPGRGTTVTVTIVKYGEPTGDSGCRS